eukprot:110629-Hanusia_phi.AAC.1
MIEHGKKACRVLSLIETFHLEWQHITALQAEFQPLTSLKTHELGIPNPLHPCQLKTSQHMAVPVHRQNNNSRIELQMSKLFAARILQRN